MWCCLDPMVEAESVRHPAEHIDFYMVELVRFTPHKATLQQS